MNFPNINIKGEVFRNEPLSNHTSFKLGGPADVLACPTDQDDLQLLLRIVKELNLNYFILGCGTNLLVRDGGFRGIVISLKRMHAITIEREYRSIGGNFAVIHAEAGATVSKLVTVAVEKGLTGLEFATGIPGSIGGAVHMNAGTSLGVFGDIISSVSMVSPDGTTVTKSGDEMEFGYRTSLVPKGYFVFDVRMVLRRGDKEKVNARVIEILTSRKQHQPQGSPNAGSIFKNPIEKSAGRLIESAGLKGTAIGGARVSEKHANFIITEGKAQASDVLALIDRIKQTVLDVHGVRLEPEIKIIGED